MIEVEQIAPDAHRIVAMAEFRQDDAQRIVDFAKEQLDSGGGGSLLIDLTSMAGFSFSAITVELAHLPSVLRYAYKLDRIAIISDEDWIRSAARVESALMPGLTYEVYDEDEADTARAWVLGEEDSPHKGAIRELDIGKPEIAVFELNGRLDRDESERGVAMVRARLEAPDCSRLMLIIKGWHGFDVDTMFSSQVMGGKLDLIGKLDRYAIVGGPDWIGGMASVIGALLKPEIRSFDLDEQVEALDWLKGERATSSRDSELIE